MRRQIHPERKPTEIFIGNFTQDAYLGITHETKRFGRIAYDKHGLQCKDTGVYPVFIAIDEAKQNSLYDADIAAVQKKRTI